jgi:hypothetical protein
VAQVDSIKNRVESAPGFWFQRLKLKCDKPLSKFAFNYSLRRYNWDPMLNHSTSADAWAIFHFSSQNKPWLAGAHFYNPAVKGVWEQHAQDYWGDPFVAPIVIDKDGDRVVDDIGWAFTKVGSAVLIALGLGLGGALAVVGMRWSHHSAKPSDEGGVSGRPEAEEQAGLLVNADAATEGGYASGGQRSDV